MRTVSRLSRWLCIPLLLPLWPAAGQKPGELYVSPLKNFSIAVPKFAFGTRVQKSNNRDGGLVVFIGGFGDRERIDYARLTGGALAGQDSAARLAAYGNALSGVAQANRAEVLDREPLSVGGEAALYALVRFPEASQAIEGGTGKRMDSFRGLLLLARGEFLYTLAVEVGGIFGASLTREQQVESGERAVQRFFGEITFQGSPIPVVRDTARAALAGAGQVVFSSTRDGNYEIYVANADGSGPSRLTNHPAEDRFPAWSPDGTRIAFVSDRDGNPEIYVMNADGSSPTRLTSDSALDGLPAWLPDGRRILFVRRRADGAQLYLMNADGSNLAQLTHGPAVHFMPAVSPDGAKIAFTSNLDGAFGIYVANADGSNPVRLTQGMDGDPVWSPDGTRIAFESGREDGTSDVYFMNADGSNRVQLTRGSTGNLLPAWSPDGAKIAFQTNRDGDWEVYVMNADGTGLVNLSVSRGPDVEPDWRPKK